MSWRMKPGSGTIITTNDLDTVARQLDATRGWKAVARMVRDGRESGLHLAIFVEPYLGFLLDGAKTVESRFSKVRCPPYGRVSSGDVVLAKKSGGPVVGVFQVGSIWSYEVDASTWLEIRKQFAVALCMDRNEFWDGRASSSFATLMKVERAVRIDPMRWPKKDRRGWVVLRDAGQLAVSAHHNHS